MAAPTTDCFDSSEDEKQTVLDEETEAELATDAVEATLAEITEEKQNAETETAAACPPEHNEKNPDPTKKAACPRKRLLRRVASDPKPPQVDVRDMLCVWGKPLKAPVVVHPVLHDQGKSWVCLDHHLSWLRRACSKEGQTHYKTMFSACIATLRKEAREKLEAALTPDIRKSLRKTLELGSDDEKEESQASSSKGRPKKSKAALTPGSVEVELCGMRMTMRTTRRPLRIHATKESIMAVVKWLREHLASAQATQKRVAKAACPQDSFSMPENTCPQIQGKVTWHTCDDSWCIHYKDENKKTQVKKFRVKINTAKKGFLARIGGLSPASSSGDVAPASGKSEWQTAKLNQYRLAIAAWNELDKSTRDKIPLVAA